jgi:hypothetical protein
MKIDKQWLALLAVAVGAAAGAAFASKSRRRYHRAVSDHREHKTHLKTWENEGGNLAPTPAPLVNP